MSGTVGLDLDQDGRSFAVLDIDRDGDEDLLVMAARQAPHLRVFQNDFAPKAATLAVRLGRRRVKKQPRCDRRSGRRRDRSDAPDQDRPGRLSGFLSQFEGSSSGLGQPARVKRNDRVAIGGEPDHH